ncbi:polyprenyl synthetase family protein [Nocardia sp. NPDC060256]|uniref:polyprenyl synthetase family protein n=1 Tax=unclassified Nocardia TaxID=2637762 RepID=UPI00364602DB
MKDGTEVSARSIAWGFLSAVHTLVDEQLRAQVRRLDEPLGGVVGYHFGWLDERGRPTAGAGGKYVRPALTLLCAEAVAGDRARAVDSAVAVELMHNFTLIHDDIIDGDRTRRHRPTVWSIFGIPAALLAGDALFSLGVSVLANSEGGQAEPLGRLARAMVDLANGQALDSAVVAGRGTSEDYLELAAKKTGALLACGCALGAAAGGGSASQIQAIEEFGHHLGLSFQMRDDVLGIWGDSRATGKPTGADLRTGKSLPLIAALASETPAADRLARIYAEEHPPPDDRLAEIGSLVAEAGGRRLAEEMAAEHLQKALAALHSIDPEPEAAARLCALAELIVYRDR